MPLVCWRFTSREFLASIPVYTVGFALSGLGSIRVLCLRSRSYGIGSWRSFPDDSFELARSCLVTKQTFSLLPSHPRITLKSKPRARSSLQARAQLAGGLLPAKPKSSRNVSGCRAGGDRETNGDLGTQGCGTSWFSKSLQAPNLVRESAAAPQ